MKQGAIQGQGKKIYKHGGEYEGAWLDGRRHGQGKHKTGEGHVYCGLFENDVYHGHGKMTFNRSSSATIVNGYYEGEWRDGR